MNQSLVSNQAVIRQWSGNHKEVHCQTTIKQSTGQWAVNGQSTGMNGQSTGSQNAVNGHSTGSQRAFNSKSVVKHLSGSCLKSSSSCGAIF